MFLPLFSGGSVFGPCFVMHFLVSFLVFAIILTRKRAAGCFTLLPSSSLYVRVLWLFLKVPWVGLQCVVMVFSDHTHLTFF